MPKDTICKIVRQYNKTHIPNEDMRKLQQIAFDYAKVKNYVYKRYGGIYSLPKLYPGYTIQNEMTKSGLREELEMPSVYFYLAIFDALRDIKIQWSKTKKIVLRQVNQNEDMSNEEKHFLRYLLKVNNAFESVLARTPLKLPKNVKEQYDLLSSQVDIKKMENYLRRQVRKYPLKLHTNTENRFSVTERAYRYGDHGIYISVKEKRKRIFIPLTDTNCYARQITVQLYPERGDIELNIPMEVEVKKHDDYTRQVGIAMGMHIMLTTEDGHIYGEKLGDYQADLSDWLREQTGIYNKNRQDNPGRKKYQARKRKKEERLHSYINQELNRFLRTEKPEIIYIPKFSEKMGKGPIKRINYHTTSWQRGYIRSRLIQKCKEQSVELIEVFAKNISNQCSECGTIGQNREQIFFCPNCGYRTEQKTNTARNVKRRGEQQTDYDHKNRNRINEGDEP